LSIPLLFVGGLSLSRQDHWCNSPNDFITNVWRTRLVRSIALLRRAILAERIAVFNVEMERLEGHGPGALPAHAKATDFHRKRDGGSLVERP